MAQSQVRLKLEERQKWQEFHFSTKIINKLQLTEFKMHFTFIAQLQVVSDCKMELFWGSLRTADVFPVVASLPPKNMERATTGNTSAVRRLKAGSKQTNNSYLAPRIGGIKQSSVLLIAEPQDDFIFYASEPRS